MSLELVQPVEPSPAQAAVERIKAEPRPDGMLQCNRCGGRAVLTVTAGASIKGGRYQAGTVIDDRVCAPCWKQGIIVPMLPELKPAK